jgi:hypothetical protein
MFHVKHFCPVPAQNLTRRKTAEPFDEDGPKEIGLRYCALRPALPKKCSKM